MLCCYIIFLAAGGQPDPGLARAAAVEANVYIYIYRERERDIVISLYI